MFRPIAQVNGGGPRGTLCGGFLDGVDEGAVVMGDEDAFLAVIRAHPRDDLPRLVYADWLDERGDPRGDFIRLHLSLRAAAPDHIDRVAGEHELSLLRKGCGPEWLSFIEPERRPRPDDLSGGRQCQCLAAAYTNRRWPALYLHAEAQDTECDGWKRLLDLVEGAASDGREEFSPLRELGEAERAQVVTLPATIARLTAVRSLNLYGSHLVRLPPEIGAMTALEEFDPYTSYKLHWFPYELTRCLNLKDSRVSTRALYGNYKYRPPFPRLDPDEGVARLPLKRPLPSPTRPCSVCGRPFEDEGRHRVWASLRVATDVLPLLVNACSEECVNRLPAPPEGYVQRPHRGGPRVQQPAREH